MIARSVLWRTAAAVLPLLLAGCASITPPSSPTSGQHPEHAIPGTSRTYHDTIILGGRISVRYQVDRKEEALHGSFNWAQSPKQATVTLLSPLGQTVAVIEVTPEGASMTQAGQPIRTATDVDNLTRDALGWPLPVSGLKDWLQGFATDPTGRRFIADPQRNEVTTRDGWRITYASWQEDAAKASQPIPRRIDLFRTTQQAGDVSIRIVIDTWQTP